MSSPAITAPVEPESLEPPPAEKPVFAASTAARPRALRIAGRATALIVGLWLVALLLGTLGFGSVAGIGLPRIGSDGSKHHDAARKNPVQQIDHRSSRAGVTLTVRHAAPSAVLTTRRGPVGHGSGARQGSRSSVGGNRGSNSSGGGANTSNSGGHTQTPVGATPATSATPTAATPTSTTTPATTHGNSSNSQATPPGSSSSAPGTRSNAGTAPGRDQSTATPSPGSGRTEHAPPKG